MANSDFLEKKIAKARLGKKSYSLLKLKDDCVQLLADYGIYFQIKRY